jgi:hypothetical protein
VSGTTGPASGRWAGALARPKDTPDVYDFAPNSALEISSRVASLPVAQGRLGFGIGRATRQPPVGLSR